MPRGYQLEASEFFSPKNDGNYDEDKKKLLDVVVFRVPSSIAFKAEWAHWTRAVGYQNCTVKWQNRKKQLYAFAFLLLQCLL